MLSITKLKNNVLQNKASGNLLKAADYLAYMHYQRIEAYSKQRVKQRMKSLDAVVEQEREKGFQAGLKAGEAESRKQLLELNLQSIDYLKSFEQQACGIIQDVLQRILGHIDQTTLIQSLVETAIKTVANEQNVKIIVSCEDVKMVKQRVGHWSEQYPNIEQLNVIADNQMAAGACRFETPVGVVDAGLHTQLKALKISMESVFGKEQGNRQRFLTNSNTKENKEPTDE